MAGWPKAQEIVAPARSPVVVCSRSTPPRPDPIRQILRQRVHSFGAQQVGEILICQQLTQRADDEQQVALGSLGLPDQLLLALDFTLVVAHETRRGHVRIGFARRHLAADGPTLRAATA